MPSRAWLQSYRMALIAIVKGSNFFGRKECIYADWKTLIFRFINRFRIIPGNLTNKRYLLREDTAATDYFREKTSNKTMAIASSYFKSEQLVP